MLGWLAVHSIWLMCLGDWQPILIGWGTWQSIVISRGACATGSPFWLAEVLGSLFLLAEELGWLAAHSDWYLGDYPPFWLAEVFCSLFRLAEVLQWLEAHSDWRGAWVTGIPDPSMPWDDRNYKDKIPGCWKICNTMMSVWPAPGLRANLWQLWILSTVGP